MAAYVLRRLTLFVPMLIGIVAVTFGIMQLLPGDPAAVLLGEDASEEAVRMEVRQVAMDPVNRTPVVVLAGAGRVLPIWIGTAEASSIARAMSSTGNGSPLSIPNALIEAAAAEDMQNRPL